MKNESARLIINWLADVDLSSIVRRVVDGSYVVKRNGLPYHVPNNAEYGEFYAQLDEYAKAHPEVVKEEHPYVPTPQELEEALKRHYTDLVQRILDVEAQKLGYDNCNSVCTYVDTGVAKFDAEGVAFRKWRSAVWAKGYELLAEVQAGTRPVPSEEELVALLPKLEIVYA